MACLTTSLKSAGTIGAASIMSRKEAARKTLMSMELPDRIRGEGGERR